MMMITGWGRAPAAPTLWDMKMRPMIAAAMPFMSAGLDSDVFVANAQSSLQILNDELPFIPLYHHPDILIVKQGLSLGEDFSTLQKIGTSVELLVPNVP